MSKKISLVVALAGMCALSLFLLNCGSSSSRPSGLLYVLTQGTSGVGNNISSFAIDLGSGGLSLINSNAPTCSTANGCGLPLDILLDPTGATAFVLNQGVPCPEVFDSTNKVWICDPTKNGPVAPTIYPYTVHSDGSLSAPGGAVTWSCGAASTCANSDLGLAMSRDATGQFLFVIDQGSNPTPGTTTPPVYPSCPHVPTGPTDVCPSISVFKMSSTGLTLSSGSPFYLGRIPTGISALTFPAPGSGTVPPCGFTASEEFLYVTSNHDLSSEHNDNALSVYCVDSSGNLTDKTPDPPYTPQVDPLSVLAVNTGGLFVYVGSQPSASGALSEFQMCTAITATCTQSDVTNAVLRPVGSAPPSTGQNPVAMVVDPTNAFLYVVCYGSNQVFGYLINSTQGTLTALSPANEPTGSQPVALALHPSVGSTGQFLFTSNSNSSNITGFTLNTTSGAMSSPITVSAPAAPSGMTAR